MPRRTAHCRLAAVLVLVATLVGCDSSPYRLVPVSGAVRLDGVPLAGARIGFEPVGGGRAAATSPGLDGETDDKGAFHLTTRKGKAGAVTGPHQVSIRTFRGRELAGGKVDVSHAEALPDCYHDATQLRFEVPAAGTRSADFDLRSDGSIAAQ